MSEPAILPPVKPARPVAVAKAEPAAEPVRDAPLPPSARDLRKARARKLGLRYVIWVGLPTLLSILYYAVLASSQYDAHAVVTIEVTDPAADVASGTGETAAVSPHQRDARLLAEYVRSRTMLGVLEEQQHVIAHYQDADHDWWSRLSGDAGTDEKFDYFRAKVAVTVDAQSSALTLRARAFSPTRAQEILEGVIAAATTWVAELSRKARDAQILPAEAEVASARAKVATTHAATEDLTANPDDPAVIAHELARLDLTAALDALKQARFEAAHTQRYLVVIDPPSKPDEVATPRPLWDITTVFVSALVLISVLSLLGAAVREHANF